MTFLDLARRSRRQKGQVCRLTGSLVLALAVCLAGLSSDIRSAAADDGSLETQKGGLFHRKGFIFPEIHRRKEPPKKTASTTTGTQAPKRVASQKPAPRPRSQRATRSTARATPRTRRLPRSVVQQGERNVARSVATPELPARATTEQPGQGKPEQPVEAVPDQPAKETPELPVKVASLTSTVPSSSETTKSEDTATGGSPPINWVASSRCLTARLRAAINYVARNYGRVRVNSTCRSRRHNRRVGGASRSFHIGGRAADIRIFGNIRAAARYLRRVAGGYKHYGGGRFHIDTGPKRSW